MSESNVELDKLRGVIAMPTARRLLWITWTEATQSEKPPLLMIVNDSGWPSLAKMPLLPLV